MLEKMKAKTKAFWEENKDDFVAAACIIFGIAAISYGNYAAGYWVGYNKGADDAAKTETLLNTFVETVLKKGLE